jgi:hypothetical protein
VKIASPKKKQRAHGTRHLRSQEIRDLVIPEATSRVLFKDSLARQQAEYAIQRPSIHLQLSSQIHGATPVTTEVIRNAQFGGGVESLMEDQSITRAQQNCA